MSNTELVQMETNGSSGEEFDWEGDEVEAAKDERGRVSRSSIDLPRYRRVLAGIKKGNQRVWRVPTGDIIQPVAKLDEQGNPVINPKTGRKVLENPNQAGHGTLEIEDEKGLKAAAASLGYSVLVEPRHIFDGEHAGKTALRIVPSDKRELKPENEYSRQVGAAAGDLWREYLSIVADAKDEELPEDQRTAAMGQVEGALKAAVDAYRVRAIWLQAREDGNYTMGERDEQGMWHVNITGPGYNASWDGKSLNKETKRPHIVVKIKQVAPAKPQAPAAKAG